MATKEWTQEGVQELAAIKKARQDVMDALAVYNRLAAAWTNKRKKPRTYYQIVASPNPPEAGIPEQPFDDLFVEG